jgi:predicted transcriptional regulator of viral defense system
MKESSITTVKLIQVFAEHHLQVISPTILKYLFPQVSDNTRYAIIKRLLQKQLISPLKPGLYVVVANPPTSYQIANLLLSPSYISLETALNHYGILSQFPRNITSVTPGKTKSFTVDLTYSYTHLQPSLFQSFNNVDGVLMATPEKAIIDYLYLASKGLRNSDISEFNLDGLDHAQFAKYPWSRKYAQ